MTDPDNQPDPTSADPDGLADAGRKALAAERQRANTAEKQLKALQTQLDEATSQLTTLQTTNGDLTAQLTDRDRANLRLTVGLEKGLPKALIDRLKGDDEETLTADADQLLQLFPPSGGASTTNQPKPDPSQGARGPAPTTPKDQFAAWAAEAFPS